MKWLVYAAVIGAALLVPVQRTDVGKLQPIEVVAIQARDHQIILRTELGDRGEGKSVEEALENMKQTTAGVIYLDTAEYLLVSPGAQEYVKEMNDYLKYDVRICIAEEEIPLEKTAAYLDSHKPKLRMDAWTGAPIGEELVYQKDRFQLLKKE